MCRSICSAALAAWLLSATAAAQGAAANHAAVPSVRTVRAAGPIVVDGRLDEDAWRQIPAATVFTQREPDEGKPVSESTELRVLYDDGALYVGVRLADREPARIARQLARRDQEGEADSFWVFLDPHHDHLTGAVFSVSAAGVQRDATIHNDTWQDDSWDAVWQSAVAMNGDGWAAEMRIPFSQLRFPAADRHTFGINAMRYIQRKKEQAWLVHVPKKENGLASRLGHLEGIEGVSPRRSVELLPYVVSRGEFIAPSADGDPFNDGARLFSGAGVDLKYRFSSNLSLDGTINPDFGQVEVDPAVVNLTAFETFFDEKRPFFIEGANTFGNFGQTGANNFWGFNRSEPLIFYSRRIGRSPQGPADGDFVDRPTASTILGAAKITGKTRNGWSLGVLNAVTGREHANRFIGGSRDDVEVEPLSNYFVGRVQREIGTRAGLGGLVTAVNRDLRAPQLRAELPAQAYVAGLDGHIFLDGKRDWVVNGRIAGSHLAGSTSAMERLQRSAQRYFHRPDASHVEIDPTATEMRGWTGSLNLNRQGGVHLVNASWWAVSPGFDSTDAGFNFNGDRAGTHAVYQWRNPAVTRVARERMFAVAKFYTWNYARELQSDGLFLMGQLQFRNYWNVFGTTLFFRDVQDDRLTRGGPSMLSPAASSSSLSLDSDSRKRLSAGINAEMNRSAFGGRGTSIGLNLRYRPAASLEVSVGPSFTRNHNLAQYVGTFEDQAATATFGSRYVFGTLHQKEVSVQTRVNYVLSPKMSLQMYMQPLVSVGAYGDFKELARPRTFDFISFGRDAGMLTYDASARRYQVDPSGGLPFGFDDPDFNFKSLRVNAIFRWEWKPGSALYIVWTEQRQDLADPGRFAVGRDLRRMLRAPADDVVMFKIAYWLQR